jgi:hypothetical protein
VQADDGGDRAAYGVGVSGHDINARYHARMAALGPKPKWWQRSKRRAWNLAVQAIAVETLKETAVFMYQLAMGRAWEQVAERKAEEVN